MYHNPEQIFHWNRANEEFLIDRQPVATVGVVWSQQNMDFYGRDNSEELVELPWRGMTQALIRARIPYLPVHADQIDRDAAQFAVLVLPDLAVMTEGQIAAVRRFVNRGGSLIATGNSSLLDEWGDPRADYGLADLYGAHLAQSLDIHAREPEKLEAEVYHSYLRLSPALQGGEDGPNRQGGLKVKGHRHEILQGFEETDILPFGGLLKPLLTDTGVEVLMTYIPQFPVFPPEKVWMREPKTDIPGIVLRQSSGGSLIAFVPADIDRQYGRSNLPDHGNLLRNIVRWAAKEDIPLTVEGAGLLDCHLYRQPHRLILHLVNLSSPGTWRQPIDEFLAIGPLQLKVKLPGDVPGNSLRLLVSGQSVNGKLENGWIQFTLTSILDHELVVIT